MPRATIVTVNGSALLQPILDLSAPLFRGLPRKLTAGGIGGLENGYAISIVLLLVVALESWIGRVSYLQSQLPRGGKPKPMKLSVPEYIGLLRKSFRMKKSLSDVFVLRDVIAHGHVWELEISDHETHGQVLHHAALLAGYGDKKHQGTLNQSTRRSSALSLNLVPSAVGIKDVAKVLDVIWKTMDFLAERGLIERSAFSYSGRLNRKPFDFWDLRQILRDAAS
jgi:hypothetical protein